MYVRLGFSVAINVDPDILLVDEVLAVGDEEFQRKCSEKFAELKESGKTIVIVSHALGTMRDAVRPARAARARQSDHGRPRARSSTSTSVTCTRTVWRDGEHGTRLGFRRGPHRGDRAARRRRSIGHARCAPAIAVTFRFHYRTTEPIDKPVFGTGIHTHRRHARSTAPNTREAGLHRRQHLGRGLRRSARRSSAAHCRASTTLSVLDLRLRVLHTYDCATARSAFDVERGLPQDERWRHVARRSLGRPRRPRPPVTDPRHGSPRCATRPASSRSSSSTTRAPTTRSRASTSLARPRLAGRPPRGRSSSTTRRATAASSASATRCPARHADRSQEATPGSPVAATVVRAAATGDYLAFLNNDARPDARWLTSAVAVLERYPSVACVASKVLDWEGQEIDFVDAALSFYGHGFKLHAGDADIAAHDDEADVLFASGAAMVVDTKVFARVGGFDERYFMFFEDVDFGWRLWLLGYGCATCRVVRLPPPPRVHGASSGSGASTTSSSAMRSTRSTRTTTTRTSRGDAGRPGAVGRTERGPWRRRPAHVRSRACDSWRAPTHVSIHKETLAAHLRRRRVRSTHLDELERRATRDSGGAGGGVMRDILPMFRLPFLPNIEPVRVHEQVRRRGRRPSTSSRVFGARRESWWPPATRWSRAWPAPRSGPGRSPARCAREHDVELVSTTKCCRALAPRLRRCARSTAPQLRRTGRAGATSCLPGLHHARVPGDARRRTRSSSPTSTTRSTSSSSSRRATSADATRRDVVRSSTDVLNEQLTRGDLFLCASDKQRDFWLGQLAGSRSHQPGDLRRQPEPGRAHHARAVRRERRRRPCTPRPALKGVVPGYRRRRQGHPVGRRHLQLVRSRSRSSAQSTSSAGACPKCASTSSG